MQMIWCGLKIKENCYVLVNHFHENFHSKTPSCRKIKSVFRDVKWCFNASWGLKGLRVEGLTEMTWPDTQTLLRELLLRMKFSIRWISNSHKIFWCKIRTTYWCHIFSFACMCHNFLKHGIIKPDKNVWAPLKTKIYFCVVLSQYIHSYSAICQMSPIVISHYIFNKIMTNDNRWNLTYNTSCGYNYVTCVACR